MKDFYHLVNFFLVTGTLNQEDSVECSDNQKEENGQDNIDKCKMEVQKTETQDEKEVFIKKEIKEVHILLLDILIKLGNLLFKINHLL